MCIVFIADDRLVTDMTGYDRFKSQPVIEKMAYIGRLRVINDRLTGFLILCREKIKKKITALHWTTCHPVISTPQSRFFTTFLV